MGHLVSADKTKFITKLAELTSPLMWFAWGVALATLAIGLSYLTNYSIAARSFFKSRHYEHPYIRGTAVSKRWTIIAGVFQGAAVILALASLGLFISGMVEIRDVIVALR
jgi:hypothetical protein